MRINREGYSIIAIWASLSALFTVSAFLWLPEWVGWIVGVVMVGLLLFMLWFFRNPRREQLFNEGMVYAPADGEVVAIEQVEETEYLNAKCVQVSVFMSIWNVHANWFPVGGRVEYFRHHHGKYLLAYHPKSSELNERTTTVVDAGTHKVLFRQVAGYVARRIVSYATPGVDVKQNDRAGFIKFGSRVDLFLPLDCEMLVLIGDKVTGSQTPIARFKS